MEGCKKSIRLMLCVVLVAAMLLPGCSKEDDVLDRDDPVSLVVWHYYNGRQQQIFDELVQKFNDTVGVEKGIIIDAYNQGTINDLTEKVMNSVEKKAGAEAMPDIFAAYADIAYDVNQRGLVADLAPYLTEKERNEYIKPYLMEGAFENNDSIKLFPIAKSTENFIMNATEWKKFAEETGAAEGELSTWEGLAKVSEMYYNWTDAKTPAADDGRAFFGRDAFANYMIIGSLQLGKELFLVENGQVTFQIDEKIMRKLWDNYYIPYINGWYGAYGRFRSDDVKTGDLVAQVGSVSASSYFPTEVTRNDGTTYPIDVKVLPVPNFENTDPVAVQQGAGMVVTKSDARREYAAAVFLKWFTEPQQNALFAVEAGYLPVKYQANDMKLLEKAMKNDDAANHKIVKDSIIVGIDTVRSYQLYTSKAFENGFSARQVVEHSMSDKAAADLENINEQVAAGVSKNQAVAAFNTEENFQSWLAGFREALEATR